MGQTLGPILFGEDAQVLRFVLDRTPDAEILQYDAVGRQLYSALGVIWNERIVAGVVFHNMLARRKTGEPYHIEITVAADRAPWVRRGTMRTLFHYPFDYLGVSVITARVAKHNRRCRRLSIGLGFRQVGCVEKAFDAGERLDDMIIYAMTREQCRWLKGMNDGQISTSAAVAA